MNVSKSKTLPPGWPAESDWTEKLQPVFETDWFQQLQAFVGEERKTQTIYPPVDDVFNAFRFTSFADTKVVILGQDPYHGPGQAHGLSFSIVNDNCKFPPSLRNIYKELNTDLDVPIADHGDLTAWARQGIMLLNTVLTVREAEANSHRKQGWEKFTDEVISMLGQQADPIVFLLWGKPAEKKTKLIAKHHEILISAHPSPLSARRGFFDSKPFSRINKALEKFGREPIEWSL